MIHSFNKVTCQKLRADLNRVLASYGATEGVTFELGNIRFTADELKITSFRARIVGAKKFEEKAASLNCAIYGLKEVNESGDRLVEYNSRRYQYPFVYVRKVDGKRYKTSLDGAKRMGFAANAPTHA